MDIQSIASRFKVCAFSKGLWFPTLEHKSETQAMAHRHHTDAGKAIVTPCKHPDLLELQKVHAQAYSIYTNTQNTLPTITTGLRMIKLTREMELARILGEFANKHITIARHFIAEYPAVKANAAVVNNGLHDPSMWPDLETVKNRFYFTVKMLPCPMDWMEWLGASFAQAQQDIIDKIEESLLRMAKNCASDAKLYKTVFSNLGDLLRLVPDLDLDNDPRVKPILSQAHILATQEKDTLVKNKDRRKDVANRANDLLSIFGKKPQ